MKTSSIFLSQGCFYHRQYRNSISSLLWNSSHHASLPLPSLSHFLLLFFSTINNQGWGLYYFALLWRCRTIVNMCIICDPFTLLVFSVRLHYESWPRLTFFNWTICDRAFYCSTWLMLSEKPPPAPCESLDPTLWRHRAREGVTTDVSWEHVGGWHAGKTWLSQRHVHSRMRGHAGSFQRLWEQRRHSLWSWQLSDEEIWVTMRGVALAEDSQTHKGVCMYFL